MIRPIDEALADFENTYRQMQRNSTVDQQEYFRKQLICCYAAIGSNYAHNQMIKTEADGQQEFDLEDFINQWNNGKASQKIAQKLSSKTYQKSGRILQPKQKQIFQNIKDEKLVYSQQIGAIQRRKFTYCREFELLGRHKGSRIMSGKSMKRHIRQLRANFRHRASNNPNSNPSTFKDRSSGSGYTRGTGSGNFYNENRKNFYENNSSNNNNNSNDYSSYNQNARRRFSGDSSFSRQRGGRNNNFSGGDRYHNDRSQNFRKKPELFERGGVDTFQRQIEQENYQNYPAKMQQQDGSYQRARDYNTNTDHYMGKQQKQRQSTRFGAGNLSYKDYSSESFVQRSSFDSRQKPEYLPEFQRSISDKQQQYYHKNQNQ